MQPVLHILGHPQLPMDIRRHPEDAQVRTCASFCALASYLHCPFFYYGVPGSILPAGGTFLSTGVPTGSWSWRNAWHRCYTKRLNKAVKGVCSTIPSAAPQILCSLYGAAQADIDTHGLPVLEPMVGYNHCWAQYRVFPSLAQQNILYATMPRDVRANPWNDTVIPHFLLPEEYPVSPRKKKYLLYLGRDAEDKGVAIARKCAGLAGIPLRIETSGWFGEAKAKLLSEALALLAPTLYPEPFGYAAIEAQMCGTPAIATAWGAYPETIRDGKTGFLCHTIEDFLRAIRLAPTLSPAAIRASAIRRFGLQAIAPRYRAFFRSLLEHHALLADR